MTPREKYYLWVDLETTGLDPERCAIIEVAAVLTTVDLEVLAEYETLVADSGAPVWEPAAIRMHAKNGLLERWASARSACVPLWDVDVSLYHILRDIRPARPILAGASVHFDRSFIRAELPELDNALHYRHLDVSAISEMMRGLGYELPRVPASEHRAMSDVKRSIALYQYWREIVGAAGSRGAKPTANAEVMK